VFDPPILHRGLVRGMMGLGSFGAGGEVGCLYGGEGVDFQSHAFEFEVGDFLFDGLWYVVDFGGEFSFLFDDELSDEGLGGEAHVHNGGGVSFGSGEVDESSFGEEEDAFVVFEGEFIDVIADLAAGFLGHFFQADQVEFDVEMSAVADDGAVFHFAEVFGSDDVFVAGEGDKEVADFSGLGHGHDEEAVHGGFEGLDFIDFGDDDVGAHTVGAHGAASAAPAVTGDDDAFAGEEEIGGADDAVHGGLTGAVAVVEEVFGGGVVDGDDGEEQAVLFFH